jgi:hypothetical protein
MRRSPSSVAAAMIFLRYLTDDEVVVEKEEQLQRREKDQAEFLTGVYPWEAVLVRLDPFGLPQCQLIGLISVLSC